jgi:hypothetical protein
MSNFFFIRPEGKMIGEHIQKKMILSQKRTCRLNSCNLWDAHRRITHYCSLDAKLIIMHILYAAEQSRYQRTHQDVELALYKPRINTDICSANFTSISCCVQHMYTRSAAAVQSRQSITYFQQITF